MTRAIFKKSEIGFMLERHPELFNDCDIDDMAIVLFYFHEKLKGDKSKFWPSIQITNLSELPYRWSEEEISEFQDIVMINYIKLF